MATTSAPRESQQNHRRHLRSESLQFPPSEIPDLNPIPSSPPYPVYQDSTPDSPPQPPQFRADLPPAKRARGARYKNHVPEEELERLFSAIYQRTRTYNDPRYPKPQHLLALKKARLASPREIRRHPFSASFAWAHLQELPAPALAADFSFGFVWVGSGASEVLFRWGYSAHEQNREPRARHGRVTTLLSINIRACSSSLN
ncbi:hypothetical protein FB451DRAFT_1414643 [Mycena latifolia]|nr:hypothetical protein FB451DRAFT_1414643 [Mycena latifolia]